MTRGSVVAGPKTGLRGTTDPTFHPEEHMITAIGVVFLIYIIWQTLIRPLLHWHERQMPTFPQYAPAPRLTWRDLHPSRWPWYTWTALAGTALLAVIALPAGPLAVAGALLAGLVLWVVLGAVYWAAVAMGEVLRDGPLER